MANINVNYINPLLKASVSVIEQACGLNVTIGKPGLKEAAFTHDADGALAACQHYSSPLVRLSSTSRCR